jgi:hypothetical protein
LGVGLIFPIPAVAALMVWLLFGDRLTLIQIAGMLVIIVTRGNSS